MDFALSPFDFVSAKSWPTMNEERREAHSQQQEPRIALACMECRLAKTRCSFRNPSRDSSSSASGTCDRCRRHHFRCVFVEAKRGRKPKSKLPRLSQELEVVLPPPRVEEQQQQLPTGSSTPAFVFEADEVLPYDDLIINRTVTLGDLLRPLTSPSSSYGGSSNDSIKCNGSNNGNDSADDPVTSGILSEEAARALFDFFMEHMTRWSNLLDKRLHTHDFVRRRSVFLYVAILSTASKFSLDPSDPQTTRWCAGLSAEPPAFIRRNTAPIAGGGRVRQLLYVLCQDLAARTFADGEERSVECCQAFILTSCWRSLHDGVSALQFGFALRLGCDLRLDAEAPPDATAPDPETQQAWKWGFRNRQRTFLVLFIMDKAQQIVNDLDTRAIPYTHKLLSQTADWRTGHETATGDGLLCACVEFRKVQDKYVSLLRDLGHATYSASSARAKRSWLLEAILADLNDCEQRWRGAVAASEHHPLSTDIPVAIRMIQFWRNSIALHLCCSLLASQRDELSDLASADSPDSPPAAIAASANSRASRVLRFWAARRRGLRGTRSGEEDDNALGFIIPPLLQQYVTHGTSDVDSVLVFHCTASAQGVLEALSSLPPQRLRTTPDPTILQILHAATVVVSAALTSIPIRRQGGLNWSPPLASSGPGPSTAQSDFAGTVYMLITTMRDSCIRASLSPEDTVHHIAQYMTSLLDYMRETE